MAQELIEFREEPRNRELLATVDWYRQVGGLSGSGPDNRLLTVTAQYFDITVQARLHQYRRIGTGIVLRADTREQTMLQWQVE
jgi:general secretion pathway protein K